MAAKQSSNIYMNVFTSSMSRLKDIVRRSLFIDELKPGFEDHEMNNVGGKIRDSIVDEYDYVKMSNFFCDENSDVNSYGNISNDVSFPTHSDDDAHSDENISADVSFFTQSDSGSDSDSDENDYEEIYMDMNNVVYSKRLSCHEYHSNSKYLLNQYENIQLSTGFSRSQNIQSSTRQYQHLQTPNKFVKNSFYNKQKLFHSLPDSCRKKLPQRKSLDAFDHLMRKLEIHKDFNDELDELHETKLADTLQLNPIESRIVFYSIRGWKPKRGISPETWLTKFPEDYSVNELYLFLLRTGNTKLAEYLKNYHVDGDIMRELVKDNLLIDERLNEYFVSANELNQMRERFYPTRLRCNALKSTFTREQICM